MHIVESTLRVVLLYNRDYGTEAAPKRGEEARAGVAKTADAAEKALRSLEGAEVSVAGIDEPSTLVELLRRERPQLAFNLCESLRGDPRYEIPVPVILESFGVAYTGNTPFALRQCLDKATAKRTLVDAGVPVPPGAVVRTEEDLARLEGPIPAMVKPSREDGSIGIESSSVCRDRAALRRRARYVLEKLRQPAIVESFVDGREFNVSVLGDEKPQVLPLAEIDFGGLPPDVPKIVSYRAKWNTRTPEYKGTVPKFGLEDEALARKLRIAALAAFRALGLRDYARVDMRVDRDGNPFVIDVNPNCDIAPDAGFCKAAARAGLDYTRLIHTIAGFALERARRAPARFALGTN